MTTWTVKLMGGEGGKTIIRSFTFPSRGKAAASLRGYGKSYITRDSDHREYRVLAMSGSK
jgi:hypothetical protein